MSTQLYDAHAHLSNAGLNSEHGISLATPDASTGLQSVVINGTSPEDWPAIIESAQTNPQVIPAIGLHPWNVEQAPDDWKHIFKSTLQQARAIGEIGLDKKNNNSDNVEKQLDAFCWQLNHAQIHNLPVSIHCLKAIGLLMKVLRTHNLPARGIHLHAFSGAAELIPELSELGAYFSFSTQQLKAERPKTIQCIRAVPPERLLVETDLHLTKLPEKSANGKDFTLYTNYTINARIREVQLDAFVKQTAHNFMTYYTL